MCWTIGIVAFVVGFVLDGCGQQTTAEPDATATSCKITSSRSKIGQPTTRNVTVPCDVGSKYEDQCRKKMRDICEVGCGVLHGCDNGICTPCSASTLASCKYRRSNVVEDVCNRNDPRKGTFVTCAAELHHIGRGFNLAQLVDAKNVVPLVFASDHGQRRIESYGGIDHHYPDNVIVEKVEVVKQSVDFREMTSVSAWQQELSGKYDIKDWEHFGVRHSMAAAIDQRVSNSLVLVTLSQEVIQRKLLLMPKSPITQPFRTELEKQERKIKAASNSSVEEVRRTVAWKIFEDYGTHYCIGGNLGGMVHQVATLDFCDDTSEVQAEKKKDCETNFSGGGAIGSAESWIAQNFDAKISGLKTHLGGNAHEAEIIGVKAWTATVKDKPALYKPLLTRLYPLVKENDFLEVASALEDYYDCFLGEGHATFDKVSCTRRLRRMAERLPGNTSYAPKNVLNSTSISTYGQSVQAMVAPRAEQSI